MPVPFCAPEARRIILWAAILASSMGFIDGSVTSIAIPAIRGALDASLVEAQWISAAYLLSLSALVLVGGAMGDRFGTARVFAWGIWIFIAASVACAFAQDPGQMIAGRAIKGVGAALMVPGSMAIIARAYPKEERGKALGLWAAASTATTAFGPVLGGMLIAWGGEWGWRMIFALNVPLGLLSIWMLRRVTGDSREPGVGVDIVGAALATVGLGLMAYALTTNGAALWIGIAATLALALFLVWEARAPHPMIRLGLFRNRSFAVTNIVTLALYFALSGVMFYLPMTAVSAWDVNEIEVTAAFIPISLLIGIMSAWSGRMADRFGPGPLMAGGSALVALAYGGLWLVAVGGDFWGRVVPLMVLAGVGLGLVVAPLTAAVMAEVPDGEQGAASGINNAVARVAGLIAVAVLGKIAAATYGTGEPGFGLPGTDPAHLAATGEAFGIVAAISAGMAALGMALALMSARRSR
ncbi:MFS transporter [Tabrizicola sp.]|uniref:MFS transporter n=1 Tax=Tabrizicola sp. TaxID=2005166 RepID=UPI003F2C8A96